MSYPKRRRSGVANELALREISIPRRAVSQRVEQAVAHAVDVEHGRGIVRAARARAQGHVTVEALMVTEDLTDLETRYSQRTPDRADRFSLLVDTSTAVLANIVAEGGLD